MNFSYFSMGAGKTAPLRRMDASNVTISDLINWRVEQVRENTRKGYVMLQRHISRYAAEAGVGREAWGVGMNDLRSYENEDENRKVTSSAESNDIPASNENGAAKPTTWSGANGGNGSKDESSSQACLDNAEAKSRQRPNGANGRNEVNGEEKLEREVLIREVTGAFCRGFAEYLLQRMKPNSACTYLQKLHTLLQQCVMQGIIRQNPMPSVSSLLPRYAAPERCYLLQEEIRRLEATPCPHESTKQAFIFACHTGLRLSDIETLQWSDIHSSEGGYMIVKMQVKTGHEVRIPLDHTARSILSARQRSAGYNPKEPIFKMYSRTMIARDLRQWGSEAGLQKHITFHVSRHTFATLMASNQCDIFVVSELCGHTSVRTTQIYARLIDKARFRAIAKLDALFPRTGGA